VTSAFRRFAIPALTVVQVAAVVVLLGLSALLVAGILPSLLGYESWAVSSANMQPGIQVDSLVVIKPVRAEQLAVNDVVVYRKPQAPDVVYMQRVLYVGTDEPGKLNFQTRGDAEPVAEQLSVAPGVSLGQVLYSIPRLGLLVDFVNNASGKFFLFGVPGLLLITDYLRGRFLRGGQPVTESLSHADRIEALLECGNRALRAAHPQLAIRAAHGVLLLDPRNRAAFGLSAEALKALEEAREHVAA
jgi:signal peptidase